MNFTLLLGPIGMTFALVMATGLAVRAITGQKVSRAWMIGTGVLFAVSALTTVLQLEFDVSTRLSSGETDESSDD